MSKSNNRVDPRIGRGWREEEDRIEVILLHQRGELFALLRRVIDHQDAIDACPIINFRTCAVPRISHEAYFEAVCPGHCGSSGRH